MRSHRPSNNPRHVTRVLDDLSHEARRLKDEFRWAANLGYTKKVLDVEKVTTPGHQDPTGSVALQQERVRRQVRLAADYIYESAARLKAAQAALGATFAAADSEKDHPKEPDRGIPRMEVISRSKHERLKKLQEKRMASGQGWGAG